MTDLDIRVYLRVTLSTNIVVLIRSKLSKASLGGLGTTLGGLGASEYTHHTAPPSKSSTFWPTSPLLDADLSSKVSGFV
jgi:hypothetical protein